MIIFAPKYYEDFKCIADKCTHNCCIGWEIDIDDITLSKYRNLCEGYGKEIIKTVENGETAHFKLGEDEKCPHLDENGLCRIISEAGEEYLCDICREHPRFYNETSRGLAAGLGMACEEAARIILKSDDYFSFTEIGQTEGENKVFDAVSLCEEIFKIFALKDLSYEEKLNMIIEKYDTSPEINSDEVWREILENLEYLDESHKELFLNYSSDLFSLKETEKMLERALSYFIYRHCFGALDKENFISSLGFSLFCERLLASAIKNENADSFEDIVRLARTVSEEIEYSKENTDAIKLEFMF